MSRYMYKVYLVPEAEEPGYTVECPDLPGLVTFGVDAQDACWMAADALETYVGGLLADGSPIPPATDYPVPDGCDWAWVCFETDASYVMGPCVSAAEAARMLGVSPGRVSQLCRDGALNHNRKGGHVFVEVASIEARLAAGPRSGRPARELVAA